MNPGFRIPPRSKTELSAEQIADLLKRKSAVDLKHEPKVKSSFTLEQYEAMANAYQKGRKLFDMPGLGKYRVKLYTNRRGDWVIISPIEGHVPMGCYHAETLADRTGKFDK